MSYVYIKKSVSESSHQKKLSKKQKNTIALYLFIISGLLIISVLFPIVRYQFEYASKFGEIMNPLANAYYNSSAAPDYSQLSNWFTDGGDKEKLNNLLASQAETKYFISIPTLNIKDATVDTKSMDLKKTLIQYPGTALPGQLGNPVIFGHSVLPQFYNPKSYLTIFSRLFKLKNGDIVEVNYDKVKYKYTVSDIYEIKANDFSVLDQRYDNKYLTLITCSPPGTYLKRLVIKCIITP